MAAMSRATRRIVVAYLAEHGMSLAEIASELGISRDTARRDLAEAPPPAPAPKPEPAAPPAPGLLLPESKQLTQDLNILSASYKGRREDVARFAIHQAAQAVRARVHARYAAQAQP